ncbi:MAG: hypothetical protein ING29_11360 [Azospirillum sp.]|jgi:hypothetical protein|nr:hypothetical protein [Azospirillum sp.]
MSLLTIAQAAADKIGLRVPASVLGNPDGEVRQLLQAIREEGEELVEMADWQEIRKELPPFSAISGNAQTGILPADFKRMVPETFWDRTNERNISAVASAVEWANLRAVNYSGDRYRFIIRSGALSIIPALIGGETLSFEYVSSQYITDGTLNYTDWQADTNTCLLDEKLITLGAVWRFKRDIGQPFGVDFETYTQRRDMLLKNNEPTSNQMLVADIFGAGRAFSGAPSSGSGTVI